MQQLGGVEAVAVFGVVRPVDPVTVQLPQAHAGQVAMPDIAGAFTQGDAFGLLRIDGLE